jgi:hypothetical protein
LWKNVPSIVCPDALRSDCTGAQITLIMQAEGGGRAKIDLISPRRMGATDIILFRGLKTFTKPTQQHLLRLAQRKVVDAVAGKSTKSDRAPHSVSQYINKDVAG